MAILKPPEGVNKLPVETQVERVTCFTLLVYDLLTTFGEEVEYFWSGPWSLSRVLFFLNRYLPLVAMMGCPDIYLVSDIEDQRMLLCLGPGYQLRCTHWIRAAFELSIIAICVNQGILLLRVWYMYSHSAIARTVACFSYAACVVSSLTMMGLSLPFLQSTTESLQLQRQITTIPGCSAPSPSIIWTVFVPSTIIHMILFGFTITRIMKVSRDLRMDQLMQRLVRDGGLVFFVSMVGARLTKDPVLAISAVAVSRLMLSIHSLAGKLKIDQNWLFNPSELSRVRWWAVSSDYGRSIVVEMDTHEPVAQKEHGQIARDTKRGVIVSDVPTVICWKACWRNRELRAVAKPG
ncbi:uncharacterized protein HD556DRAFT_1308905 [Suillus plorans]|uniref:DUF6533 domain-containing protein n=1 Tax=Suillus plorans TaxID=116603 RepID=A0A9P7DHL6_9AGAM|nr:uncharacterized protein HD556DRAFT_1308905 [Suillus plorans]KAG1793192.1 hypothetical protein HD556DRAFT_1308905 [Suillus plorans]